MKKIILKKVYKISFREIDKEGISFFEKKKLEKEIYYLEGLKMIENKKKRLSISNFSQYMKNFTKIINNENILSEGFLADWNESIQFYIWSKKTGKPPNGIPVFTFWLKSENDTLFYNQGVINSPDVKLTIAVSNLIKLFKGQLDFPTAAIQNKIKGVGWLACLWKIQELIDLVMTVLE